MIVFTGGVAPSKSCLLLSVFEVLLLFMLSLSCIVGCGCCCRFTAAAAAMAVGSGCGRALGRAGCCCCCCWLAGFVWTPTMAGAADFGAEAAGTTAGLAGAEDLPGATEVGCCCCCLTTCCCLPRPPLWSLPSSVSA
uniref:(northern house mosquito) hypothetical protein n=1 Tax=Culex pipiens TaxID=7175 RepID=A0A8D8B3G9_CULPI